VCHVLAAGPGDVNPTGMPLDTVITGT